MIVDDSRDVLRAAREFLEKEGVAVVGVATTSEEAVSLVLERQPDVALVDILLGLESGFDLIRRLAQEDDVGCRAILISTHDEADFADLIAASPAIGFLPKSELSAAAIQRLLTAAHTDRED